MILRISTIFRMQIYDYVLFSFYYIRQNIMSQRVLALPPQAPAEAEMPGRRGEFVDFTYKRFDGLTQRMRYSDLDPVETI